MATDYNVVILAAVHANIHLCFINNKTVCVLKRWHSNFCVSQWTDVILCPACALSMCYQSTSRQIPERRKADLSRRQQHFHGCSTRIAVEWARDRVNTRAVYCTVISWGECVIGGMNILLLLLLLCGPKTAACFRLLSELVLLNNKDMKVKYLCHLISQIQESWHAF